MNKLELIESIEEKAGITHLQACAALEAVLSSIARTLRDGDKVKITRFGTFDNHITLARTWVNSKTGEEVQLPDVKTPVFRVSKELKAYVNSKD